MSWQFRWWIHLHQNWLYGRVVRISHSSSSPVFEMTAGILAGELQCSLCPGPWFITGNIGFCSWLSACCSDMANVAALFELYVLYQRTIIVKVVGTSTTKTFSFHNLSSFFSVSENGCLFCCPDWRDWPCPPWPFPSHTLVRLRVCPGRAGRNGSSFAMHVSIN